MKIGFDAKRAFHNQTGLGNYSRTLISSLATQFAENKYYLINPKPSTLFKDRPINCIEINPTHFIAKLFPALWRSRWCVGEIEKSMDIYHGLSHELPYGIQRSKVKKVVTIHDLIFEKYPEQYAFVDRWIYRRKIKLACQFADKIIAISEQTKKDLIDLYQIPSDKIVVCYQSCDQRFFAEIKEPAASSISLPPRYFLSVGSIIVRKNLGRICAAFQQILQQEPDIKLVVIGKGGKYKQKIIAYLQQEKIIESVLFLEDKFTSADIHSSLPWIYKNAIALVYPSLYEGFGIPVIEAQASGTVVITSTCSSLVEAVGDAAIGVNPLQVDEIAKAMQGVMNNQSKRTEIIKNGKINAAKFNNENCANAVMEVYKSMKHE